ncbi:hypothetical protein [Streptococcus suis]|uniref:hypothetical protein n=1 Tax=Streptococcus suis TaxID=1307 RepID=UPI000C1A15A9|nr:hypothetical protein [Streptococcus suis]NQP42896.1 hypothetical protein [Streptococcus suis]
MIKKYLPIIRQVLMKIAKRIVRLTFWGLFFLLRVILFYHLCRWAYHPHWLALVSGFVLACGSDERLFQRKHLI